MPDRRRSLPLILAIITLAFPGANRAFPQGVVRDSVGAIASGRGGTNIAHFDNLSVILDNPAGLVNIPEFERLDFGFDILFTDLDYTDPQNNADAEVMPMPLPQFGYMKKYFDQRLALGIGVFAPAGFGAEYNLRHALYGKREYTSLGALIKVLPAVAWKVNKHLSIGATFGLAFSHVQLEMPFNLQTGPFSGIPMIMDLKATGVAPTYSLGLQYRFNEQTTVGLAFRGETRFRLKGDADIDISGFGFPLLKASYDLQADLVWPRSLGAGVSHKINDRHRVSADVVWFDWSHAFDKLDLRLSDGSNRLFDLVLGKVVRDTLPLRWHDSIAFRFGYEFFATPNDIFRIGYIFHDNPIPNSTLFPNLAGILEHAISLGYGHTWQQWGLDVAYQYSWSDTNQVGVSRLVGSDYNHSSVKAQAHWLFLGLSYRF